MLYLRHWGLSELNFMDDLFDEFLGYNFYMGADVVKCPHCGKDMPCSLFFDDDVSVRGA